MTLRYAVLLLLFSATSTFAHGDAEWIMKDARTAYCCGPKDCERVPAGGVVEQQGGWFIPATGQLFTPENTNVFPSRDGDFWWCRFRSYGENGRPDEPGKVKCLFIPVNT